MKKIRKQKRTIITVALILAITVTLCGCAQEPAIESEAPSTNYTTHPTTVPSAPPEQETETPANPTTEPATEPPTEPTEEAIPEQTEQPSTPATEQTVPEEETEPPASDPPATVPPATPPATTGGTCSWAHDYGEFTVILEPTTTSEGLEVAYCKNCGEECTSEIERLIIPEKLENIDPRITILTANGNVSYEYKSLAVWDLRSWGGAPIMVITEDDCLDITYFKQDGSKVVYLLEPVEDAAVWISIWEDGSYRYHIFDGFENVDGSAG